LIVDAKMPSSVDDSDIQNFLRSQINEGFVPGFGANSLYFVFTPSGVKVTLQGDASCQQFCGYHNVTNEGIVYAVDPYDDCAGCQFVPGDILGSTTVPASHELCEAITDPTFEGWFDDSTGQEIGDICAGQVKVINASGVASAGASPSFASSVSPSVVTVDGTQSVNLTVTLTPMAGGPPMPPPGPPPAGQNWAVQKEWSNSKGSCL